MFTVLSMEIMILVSVCSGYCHDISIVIMLRSDYLQLKETMTQCWLRSFSTGQTSCYIFLVYLQQLHCYHGWCLWKTVETIPTQDPLFKTFFNLSVFFCFLCFFLGELLLYVVHLSPEKLCCHMSCIQPRVFEIVT